MLIARVGWPAFAKTLCGGYSKDQGNTWTAFSNAPGCTNGPGTIALSADGSRLVWAPSAVATVYSSDNGQTWTQSAGAPSNGVVVSDRVNPAKFYTFDQTTGTFYVSADGAQTFKAGASGLGTFSFKQASVVPGVEGDIWLSLQWNGSLAFDRFRDDVHFREFCRLAGFGRLRHAGARRDLPGALFAGPPYLERCDVCDFCLPLR